MSGVTTQTVPVGYCDGRCSDWRSGGYGRSEEQPAHTFGAFPGPTHRPPRTDAEGPPV